jgi:hypothetical protein
MVTELCNVFKIYRNEMQDIPESKIVCAYFAMLIGTLCQKNATLCRVCINALQQESIKEMCDILNEFLEFGTRVVTGSMKIDSDSDRHEKMLGKLSFIVEYFQKMH